MKSIRTGYTKIIFGCAVGRIILTMELSKSARKFALSTRPYGPTLGINMKAVITTIVILEGVTMGQMKNGA